MAAQIYRLILVVATLILGCCNGSLAGAVLGTDEPLVLYPINLRDYESALGIYRRSGEEFADLDLSTQSQLIYGRPGGMYQSRASGATFSNNGQMLASFCLPI